METMPVDKKQMKFFERIAQYRFFNKLTYREIGMIVGCSEAQVSAAIDKATELDLLPKYAKGKDMSANVKKEKRVQKLERAHDKILDRMSSDEVIKDASLSELSASAKRTFEMMRLEEDKSTQNMGVAGFIKMVEAANEGGGL